MMGRVLQIIHSGELPPEAVMAKDAGLLAALDPEGSPILHLYDWEGSCLTYGYFTDPFHYLRSEALTIHGLRMAKRPTGGGIILHLTDLAFSVLLPASHPSFSMNTLENYALINQRVAQAVGEFTGGIAPRLLESRSHGCCHSFCMAHPTHYDLIIDGKKVGGAAQRRTKRGLLHQGSISLTLPPVDLLQEILMEKHVWEAMKEHSYCLLPAQALPEEIRKARKNLKEGLHRSFALL